MYCKLRQIASKSWILGISLAFATALILLSEQLSSSVPATCHLSVICVVKYLDHSDTSDEPSTVIVQSCIEDRMMNISSEQRKNVWQDQLRGFLENGGNAHCRRRDK